MSTQPRQPAGSPEGGRFAAMMGAEAGETLADLNRPELVSPALERFTFDDPDVDPSEDFVRLADVEQFLAHRAGPSATAYITDNRSALAADGHIRGTFTTEQFDVALEDDELRDLPEDSRFGRVAETDVEYADSGAVLTTFATTDGTEVAVEIVDRDEDHGPIISITTPDGQHGTYYSDGEHAWDDEIDGAYDLVRYGVDLHQLVIQAESAVRYAALAAAHDNIMAIATGARKGSPATRSAL